MDLYGRYIELLWFFLTNLHITGGAQPDVGDNPTDDRSTSGFLLESRYQATWQRPVAEKFRWQMMQMRS